MPPSRASSSLVKASSIGAKIVQDPPESVASRSKLVKSPQSVSNPSVLQARSKIVEQVSVLSSEIAISK